MSTLPTPPEASAWSLAKRFIPIVWPSRWPALATAVLVLLNPVLAAVLLWLLKQLVDEVLIEGRLELLAGFIGVYVVLISGKLALDYAIEVMEASIVEQVVLDLRVALYRHLLSLSPGSISKYRDGDVLTHLSGDVERTEFLLYSGPLAIFSDAISTVFFLGFLFLLSWKLTLCALLVTPLLIAASLLVTPRIRRAARIGRWKTAGWMSLAEDRLGAIPIIWAFRAQPREEKAFAQRCGVARRAELRTVAIQASLTVMIEAVACLGGLVVLAIGAHEIRNGGMTVGTLVAFLGSIGSLYSPATGLARAAGRVQRAAAAAQRFAAMLDTPSLVGERSTARDICGLRGRVELRDVEFAYPLGPKVLDRVSLSIEPGEMLALVGPSGSGKSTLLNLLLRVYDPTAGVVLIDGLDMRDMTLDALLRCVAPVFQEPYIVNSTVADNIRYGAPGASEQQARAMARAAHADAFINGLSRGYATPVGPRGARLSGGQRQRISLARALLREAPILLLDEATASVDSETEELIRDAVERFSGKRTIIIVAHRLSSVRRANRIVVLEGGRIVETGSPTALLARPSRCRQLFEAQIEQASAGA